MDNMGTVVAHPSSYKTSALYNYHTFAATLHKIGHHLLLTVTFSANYWQTVRIHEVVQNDGCFLIPQYQ